MTARQYTTSVRTDINRGLILGKDKTANGLTLAESRLKKAEKRPKFNIWENIKEETTKW